MDNKKNIILQLWIIFFTLSISNAVLPCSLTYVYGLFGEVRSVAVAEDNQTAQEELSAVSEKRYSIKRQVNINRWLEIALLFYSYLNDKEDDFLEKYNYSREEVKMGLRAVLSQYGLDSLGKMFLSEI